MSGFPRRAASDLSSGLSLPVTSDRQSVQLDDVRQPVTADSPSGRCQHCRGLSTSAASAPGTHLGTQPARSLGPRLASRVLSECPAPSVGPCPALFGHTAHDGTPRHAQLLSEWAKVPRSGAVPNQTATRRWLPSANSTAGCLTRRIHVELTNQQSVQLGQLTDS